VKAWSLAWVLGAFALLSGADASAMGVKFDLCAMTDIAVVARAMQKRSFYDKEESRTQNLPPSIVTEVTFETEAVFLGSVPPVFNRTFDGGTVGRRTTRNSGTPNISVGDRWLFLYHERQTPGDGRLLLFHYIPPDAQLPGTAMVKGAWRRLCAEHPEGVYKGDTITMKDGRIFLEHPPDPDD
jgi:hypothetical protein